MEPSNMDYMATAENPSFFQQPSTSQTQQPSSQQQTSSNQTNNLTLRQQINAFLHTSTGTILISALAFTIGFALKDVVAAFVTALLEPSIVNGLNMIGFGTLYDFTEIISPKDNAVNMTSFISSLVTFLFTLIVVYFLSKLL
jgi:large-conductance mechanosensitive channel